MKLQAPGISWLRRRARVLVVAVAAVGMGAVAPVTLVPAAGQVAPPTVTVTATDGSIDTYSFCSDYLLSNATPGHLTISRSGDISADLTVAVSYSGDSAGLSASIFLAAGQDSATVDYDAQQAQTATLTIEPDASYQVGDPASATVAVQAVAHDPTCRSNEQTIRVGDQPADIPVDQIEPAIAGQTMRFDGYGNTGQPDLGGLAFDAHGRWSGQAGRVGDFTFLALWCETSNGPCVLGEQVTVHVIPLDETPPPAPPQAPPAAPRRGTSSFTG